MYNNTRLSALISRTAILPFAAAVFLAGCANEPQVITDQGQETQPTVAVPRSGDKTITTEFLSAPKAPASFDEIQNTPAGPLSGMPFQDRMETNLQFLDRFPPLNEQSPEEDVEAYWAKLVSLYSESYPNPANLLIQNAFGDPNASDTRFHLKKNYNIEIILDASGSMAGKIGEQTKMEIAKNAIHQFMGTLPKEAKVGLRVYGHKGSNQEKDKELSCSSSELVFSFQETDRTQLGSSLQQFQATGWTPMAKALKDAAQDLAAYDEKENTNIIFLVSDGVETCGGNPAAVAKTLKSTGANPFIHVVGFDVDQQGQQQLKQVAAAVDGLYANVNTPVQLQEQFNRAGETAKRWADHILSSNQQAYDIKSKNYGDLNEWRSQNKELNEREAANLREAIQYLQERNILTMEQGSLLQQRVLDRQSMIVEAANSLWNELLGQNDQNYLKIIEDNAKKMKENTPY